MKKQRMYIKVHVYIMRKKRAGYIPPYLQVEEEVKAGWERKREREIQGRIITIWNNEEAAENWEIRSGKLILELNLYMLQYILVYI